MSIFTNIRKCLRRNNCETLVRDIPQASIPQIQENDIKGNKKTPLHSAVWFITWKCNFKCPYCWEVQRIQKGELKVEPFKRSEDWAAAWNRLAPDILDISGGEPFLQPEFIELLQALDSSIKIAITTNLSQDLTGFAQNISPEKICSMTLSLHPTQKMSFDIFCGKLYLLKNRGFSNLTVNFVGWPEQLWLIEQYKEFFEKREIRFHVDPYRASPYFPYSFNGKEHEYVKTFVEADREHFVETIDKSPVHCSGGLSHLNVDPSGQAYRCIHDKIEGMPALGNILNTDFALNTAYTLCNEYWRCPGCDRDKVIVKPVTENDV